MTTSECVVYRMSQHILFTVWFSHVFMLLLAIVAWRLKLNKILTSTEWLIVFFFLEKKIQFQANRMKKTIDLKWENVELSVVK